jgi:hypothetical protein
MKKAGKGEYNFDGIPQMFDVPVFACMAGALPFVGAYLWNAGCGETMLSSTNNGKTDASSDWFEITAGKVLL